MSEWREVFLEDVADELTVGYVGPMALEYIGDGIPFLRSLNIEPLRIKKRDLKFISPEFHRRIRKSRLTPGDVVIVRTGKPGACAMIPGWLADANCSDLVIVRCGKQINNRFLMYYVNTVASVHVAAHLVGAVQQHFNVGSARSLRINLPPLPEQKAIAAVLSSLDDKIDLLHRQNQTIEAMAETLFRQWFVEKAQEDWEETCLGNHIEAYRGLSYKGSGLSDVGFGIPMHNLNSVYEGGGYKEVGIKFYSGEFKERHLLKVGDIIVANTEQGHEFKLIGFPAIIPATFGNTGLFSQHIYRLVPKQGSYLTPIYLYYLLMTPYIREQVISATNGSTVNMLAIDGLQRPVFRLPPKEKIGNFSTMVKPFWHKKEVNHFQIRTLKKLRDTLLPKLMSGEVRVAL
jgi:type I restriction enzyme S subunit